jgi:outer membrane protein
VRVWESYKLLTRQVLPVSHEPTGNLAPLIKNWCFLMRALSVLAALLLPASVLAQAGPPGWSLGAGVVVSESAYRGSDDRVIPIPAVRYESESLYLLGLEAGVHLQSSQRWRTELFLSARLDGADDIALVGSRADVERDDGVDLGLRLTYVAGATQIAATAKRDALGVSDGAELGVKVSRLFNVGRSFITPGIGVRFLDSRLANYYYGTLANEVIAGSPFYRPGSATVVEASVTALLPLQSSRWALFSQVTVSRLPGSLSDSPLVDQSTLGSFIAGATYQF